MSSIELLVFPSELLQLVHLRYLELRFRSGNPPESISHLRELETLIMSSRMNMVVPQNIWKIINLKHLCIKSGENLVNFSDFKEELSSLESMQTMSLLSPTRQCRHILARTCNLQKLGLCGPVTTKGGDLKFPDLGQLVHLKTLKLLNTVPLCKPGRLSDSITFPESLRNLTMSNTYLDWKEAWVFEMIPNLEVLKLKLHAFVGKEWETSVEAFPV
ncbi:putative leucine-rich repeat domain, L domain-like protein [Heracleum sosnowskyi]|uniref:Leucine-rich repeat domain, L domain-like protein n=1 Tax=Heracleum sosnowskyi TaxID=360622 RepID=A0AAD8I730_9APIA|nr:putative leucine-rich repeat domain, L domain-like protein [Heracleum sosnowskyi]